MKTRFRLGLAAAAVMLSAAFIGMNVKTPAVRAEVATAAAPASSVAGVPRDTASYADLVSRVSPSVVTVRSQRMVRAASQQFDIPEELRPFFGDGPGSGPSAPRRQGALGSGVIVSADGYILTNHHVVDGAQKINVDLSDHRTLTARLVGSDAPSDLAVLKIDAKDLPALPMGDSAHSRVGDVVLAFGNPLGIGQTVTMGIISAKGRATGAGDGSFEDFIQTDAPINQGNSGGALVNLRGELVGINSQIVSPSGGNIGIGFAIPSAMASNVMQQLRNGGRVARGQLGVTAQTITSDVAQSLGMSEVRGALVGTVTAGSPAAKAGIKQGDVILKVDGTPIDDSNSLRNRISGTKPGSHVELSVLRDGREQTIGVNLGQLQARAEDADDDTAGGTANGPRLGLTVRPLSPEAARRLGLAKDQGLEIAGVDPEGPAAQSGFQPGDIIRTVDGKPVADAASLRAAVGAAKTRPALVLVARDGGNLFLTLDPRG